MQTILLGHEVRPNSRMPDGGWPWDIPGAIVVGAYAEASEVHDKTTEVILIIMHPTEGDLDEVSMSYVSVYKTWNVEQIGSDDG